MNDTQALFARLTALAAYFEGGDAAVQAEEVFSARAILAEGRVAPTERIVPAAEAEAAFSPREAVKTLLQNTAQASALPPAEVKEGNFIPLPPNGVREGSFAPLRRGEAAAASGAEEISRAFSRDARRYDES